MLNLSRDGLRSISQRLERLLKQRREATEAAAVAALTADASRSVAGDDLAGAGPSRTNPLSSDILTGRNAFQSRLLEILILQIWENLFPCSIAYF